MAATVRKYTDVYAQCIRSIDDFGFTMNSINWIIDMQITEKRPIYLAHLRGLVGKTIVQCFDVNGKNCDDRRIRFAFNIGKKYV